MSAATGLSDAKRLLLQRRLRGEQAPVRPDDRVQPRPPGSRIPISAEQRRVWLHAALQPNLPLYNEPITIHRRGAFSLPVMEAALAEILRRHEAWRTSFVLEHGDVVQVVHPEMAVRLKLIDLSHLAPEAGEAEAARLATEDARQPIDLGQAPLFRARVVRMAPDDHRLYLTLHHIIFDGVSIYRVLMPELAATYEALSAGLPPPFGQPALQYGDYALWRDRHVSGPAMAKQLDYWRGVFAGPLPVLQLPTDHPRPASMSHRGAMEVFTLPGPLVEALREQSRLAGVTLYMVLLAAFKALLFRYTRQADIIVGGAADARRRPELEGLMGYFLDTFAMRTRPDAAMPFAAYLHQVRDAVLGALGNADVPFDRIVQDVAPRRDTSHHPIFQVFFSIEPPVAPFAEGWDLTQMDVTVGSSKFDLYLELDERPGHMAARFMYSTDLFDPPTIRRMADHWLTILAGVCRDPACPLGRLPLLSPAETETMRGWNDTARPVFDGTVHALVEQAARRTPDRPCVTFEGTSWTYAQLDRTVRSLAARLAAEGAGPRQLVALYLDRSAAMVAGLLAVLRTGAAYLPLDPAMPSERLQLCLDTAMPVLVLTDANHVSDLPPTIPYVLVSGEAGPPAMGLGAGAGSDLAYVIHTSGSTGRPKAVEVTHAALVNLLEAMQVAPGFTPADTLLAVTTLSFDIAGLELLLPLVAGGRLVVASRDTATDPFLLAAAIEQSGCTVMQATPATWRGLLATGWPGRPGLRVLCGGEPLTRDLADALLARGMTVWNMYGPTETTIWSLVHPVTPGTGPVPVGRPIANTTTYVLDPDGQLVPVGIPGELHIGGTGLSRGYRGQPALTQDRFAPVAAAGGATLYRTGDMAVFRADGTVECRGRIDNQVKVRGFRIELEEVEGALVLAPSVQAAAAKVWPDPAGGLRLAGYVVAQPGSLPDPAALRRFLQPSLPDYMIPSDITVLPALPLTPNGKVDRNALPPPGQAAAKPAQEVLTPDEQALAEIWTELLGVAAVGRGDDFFDLGGHSLMVARLQQRIAAAFGRRLSMAAIFHAPTVAQQAALLQDNANPARLIPIQRKGTRTTLFWIDPPPRLRELSAALGPDQPVYGVALAPADVDALGAEPSMASIAAHHVRTIMQAQPAGPYVVAGLCTGGIVAFEVAAQLRAAGQDVALLVLLDSQNPAFFRRFGPAAVELSKLAFYLPRALRAGRDMNPRIMLRRIGTRIRQLREPLWSPAALSPAGALTEAAAYRYQPPQYDGPVQLLQAIERPRLIDFRPGWQAAVTGALRSSDVPGHHEHLFAPGNVGGLAARLADSLAEARPRPPQAGG